MSNMSKMRNLEESREFLLNNIIKENYIINVAPLQM